MYNDPLFSFYKRARNRLRRHEPESMLTHAFNALHQVHSDGIDVLRRYQPWNILLAIKWALQEADALSRRRPPADLNDFHAVLKVLHEIGNNIRMPSEYEHVSLFMRHLAFQQFSFQQGPCAEALVRQDLLFSLLSPDHFFSREFQRLTGVRPADFMELAFAMLTLLLKTPTPKAILRDNFNAIEPGLAPGALDGFLQHLSKSIPELHAWLAGEEFRNMSVADQKILPSPLLDAPLVRAASGAYIVIFPTLLMRSLESVVYRTLRCGNPAEFGDRFGPIFEKYVGRCLTDAGLRYLDENGLKAQLPGVGKCVDFLFVEEDCNVLIDAKGIEMSARGRVSQRADLVLQAIKNSAVKAIEQGMATSRRIKDLPSTSAWTRGGGDTFLLVVTFDDLFLGSNFEFGAIFGKHLLPKLEQDYGSPLPIPLEHVFFLTIDELERLLVRMRPKTTMLVDILRYVRTQDAHRHTRKFKFQQHLDSFGTQERRLPMLEAGLDDLCQRCILRLSDEQRKTATKVWSPRCKSRPAQQGRVGEVGKGKMGRI